MNLPLTRRDWLTHHAVLTAVMVTPFSHVRPFDAGRTRASRLAAQVERIAPDLMQTLALQAIDVARTAGAQYADARLTRTVQHEYNLGGQGLFWDDDEQVGVGIRVLVNGYWGFAASPYWTADEVARLAREAVQIATANAQGPTRPIDLGHIPVVTGTWATPVRLDPFAIPIEEKLDHIGYWKACAAHAGVEYIWNGIGGYLKFVRQERVVATSDGSLVTQTLYESGGLHELGLPGSLFDGGKSPRFTIHDIGWTGKGWELFLDAQIPQQFGIRRAEALARASIGAKPSTVGRYTLVCDGPTMAALVGETVGIATQLDRALGYEANAGGTSFIDDPLAMVGALQVASPLVTVTTNRSARANLATVAWDDESIVPRESTVIKDGVLVDFQTTREQAAWLAPYYQRRGLPVRSTGCAAAEDALSITMQHMPNLALEPSPSAIRLEDLVADVKDGILIEGGGTWQVDFQARNGLLGGAMREIKNGRLGRELSGGAVQFNTLDLWRHVMAVGGVPTVTTCGMSRYDQNSGGDWKGQPGQSTSYSVRAVAVTIANQPLIDPARKV